ncbi:MAG: nucleotide sugar dehydrogenase [Pararhodobacter sp.]
MRIAVIGLGLVALGDALALARQHEVVMTGPVPERVDAINAGRYPLEDPALAPYLRRHPLRLSATLDTRAALKGAAMVLISSPLSLDPATGAYQTVELESRIEMACRLCPGVPIVIRSAVPIGFTERMRTLLEAETVIFAPEFTREGQTLHDALHPRFLIVGDRGAMGARVSAILLGAAMRPGVPVKLMGATEAEAVKHFSQAYLAARVTYFNELDSYALAQNLDAKQVIDGVCLDPRIGSYSNNPCFGYGGYRLPRSAQFLTDTLGKVPAHVVPTLARANETRLAMLTQQVLERAARRIGLYHPTRITPEGDPMLSLRDRLVAAGAEVELFTPDRTPRDFVRFKRECDLVVAQRMTPEIADIRSKVFSRDLYPAV